MLATTSINSIYFGWALFLLFNNLILASDTDSIIERKLSNRIVHTKYGALRGYIATLPDSNTQQVQVFLGVPYANPPIGKLRFMPPVSSATWSGLRSSHTASPVCPQNSIFKLDEKNVNNPSFQTYSSKNNFAPSSPKRASSFFSSLFKNHQQQRSSSYWRKVELNNLYRLLRNQSEDCLYLNIYSPQGNNFLNENGQHKNTSSSNDKAVMVFIHGESYESNAGSVYDGTALASYGDVVVVTINYRLGALGFFPAIDGVSRGNFGLMDQVAALDWIQTNIGAFNGDANNVTIVGHGHGAACVHLLMISSMAKGLFHRAIIQSGSAYAPWAMSFNALKYAYQFVKHLGCSQFNETFSSQGNSSSSNVAKTQTTSLFKKQTLDENLTSNKANANYQSKLNSNQNDFHSFLFNNKFEIMQCLRAKSVEQILQAQRSIQVPNHLTAFGPTLDGLLVQNLNTLNLFLHQQQANSNLHFNSTANQQTSKKFSSAYPQFVLSSKNNLHSTLNPSLASSLSSSFSSLSFVPLMLGLSRLDLRWEDFDEILNNEEQNPNILRENVLRTLVQSFYTYHLNEIYLTISNEYTDWSKSSLSSASSILDSLLETISDATIVAPLVKIALVHSKLQKLHQTILQNVKLNTNSTLNYSKSNNLSQNSPYWQGNSSTYLYCFAYIPERLNQDANNHLVDLIEPTHGSELAYLFGHPLLSNGSVGALGYFPNRKYTREEQNLSRQIIIYWTNFAKYGNPNINQKSNQFAFSYWPSYDEQQQQYLSISLKSKVRDNYHAHRLSFWLNLIPKLHTAGAFDNKMHLKSSIENDLNQNTTSLHDLLALDVSYNNYAQSPAKHLKNSLFQYNQIMSKQTTSSNTNLFNLIENTISNLNDKQLNSKWKKNHTKNVDNNLHNSMLQQKKQILNLDNLDNLVNTQVGYDQISNQADHQIINYYSKSLMLTIVAGIFMFILNITIFIFLMNRKRKQDKLCRKNSSSSSSTSFNQKCFKILNKNDQHQQQHQQQQQQKPHQQLHKQQLSKNFKQTDKIKVLDADQISQFETYQQTDLEQLQKLEDETCKNDKLGVVLKNQSIYNLENLLTSTVTLHETENNNTNLKWYATSYNNHHQQHQDQPNLPLNVSGWSNNYLLFEQHSNDLTDLPTYATNIDLNTLNAIDSINKLNDVYTSFEHENMVNKLTNANQHLNETNI